MNVPFPWFVFPPLWFYKYRRHWSWWQCNLVGFICIPAILGFWGWLIFGNPYMYQRITETDVEIPLETSKEAMPSYDGFRRRNTSTVDMPLQL